MNRDGFHIVHLTNGEQLNKAIGLVNSGEADGINFNFIKNSLPSLSELINCKGIKYVQINATCDFSVLNQLEHLEHISLYAPSKTPIHFESMKNLNEVAVMWCNKYQSIFNCINLSRLFLGKYSEKDLNSLKKLEHLKYFRLNTGSVISLQGIENLVNLTELWLMQNTKLISLDGIEHLRHLELAYIDNCKNIVEYQGIFKLPQTTRIRAVGTTDRKLNRETANT